MKKNRLYCRWRSNPWPSACEGIAMSYQDNTGSNLFVLKCTANCKNTCIMQIDHRCIVYDRWRRERAWAHDRAATGTTSWTHWRCSPGSGRRSRPVSWTGRTTRCRASRTTAPPGCTARSRYLASGSTVTRRLTPPSTRLVTVRRIS